MDRAVTMITGEVGAFDRPINAERSSGFVAGIHSIFALALLLLQLGVMGYLLERYSLETQEFRWVFGVAAAGFVVHHFLPRALRTAFFLALTGCALVLILSKQDGGWSLTGGLARTATIAGVGGVLIGICHLPVGFWMRAMLLALAGAVIAVFRAGIFASEMLEGVWPIVASIFMFRLITYLYDLSTMKERPGILRSMSYFFLLPNLASPLFPVIDFKTFCRSSYDQDELAIYQRGARWMTRGVLQIVLYRFISRVLYIKPQDVVDGTDLIQFILTNSLFYLHVSGQFHFVIGMLLLFGFNLPETNHRYFLASSFTDYWRRVNIYWKDFVMKVFYYPSYFRVKKLGATQALILATLFSFFVTWVLHAYQSWWLNGRMSFSWPDTLFWGTLAILVLGNSLWEMKRGRKRVLSSGKLDLASAAGLAMKTVLTFAVVSILWSLWSSPSMGAWIGMWSRADWNTAWWAAGALAAVAVATVIFEGHVRKKEAAANSKKEPGLAVSIGRFAMGTVPMVLLLAVGVSAVQVRAPARIRPFLEALAQGNSPDLGGANRGYYEQLMRDKKKGTSGGIPGSGETYVLPVKDYRISDMIPNVDVQAHGQLFHTNRWGFRDRDYESAKPPQTVRMAVLGSSNVMAFGVRAEEGFENLLEERLNREARENAKGGRVEILNFAMGGYSPISQIDVFAKKAAAFEPDIVLFVSHSVDYLWACRDVHQFARDGIPIRDEFLRRFMDECGVNSRTNQFVAMSRVRPRESELVLWSYRRLVSDFRSRGSLPVAVFMPLPWESASVRNQASAQKELLANAGFELVDLSGVFDGQKRSDILMPQWQSHCSPFAHKLLADSLYKALYIHSKIDLAGRLQRASADVRKDQTR